MIRFLKNTAKLTALTSIAVFSMQNAFAGGTGEFKVTDIDALHTGAFFIQTDVNIAINNDQTCNNNNNRKALFVSSTNSGRDNIYSSAMAALINGNTVNAFTIVCNNNIQEVVNFNINR